MTGPAVATPGTGVITLEGNALGKGDDEGANNVGGVAAIGVDG